jgi:hypothetical protein
MLTKRLWVWIPVLAAVVLSACPSPTDSGASGYGRVTVCVGTGGGAARTILPDGETLL